MFHSIARVVVALGLMSSGGLAYATDFIWSGGGGDNFWGTGPNWSRNVAPPSAAASTNLHFAGSLRLNPFAEQPYTLNSLFFETGAGSFTLSGGTLTLGAGGITQNSANAQTINNAIVLNAAQTWTLRSGSGSLNIGGTTNNNGKMLTVNAASGTTAQFTSTLTGTGNLTKAGDGTLILAGANNYGAGIQSGQMDTTISGGTLRLTGSLNGTTGTAITFTGNGTFDVNEAAGVTQGMDFLILNTGYATVESTYAGSGSGGVSFSQYIRAEGATGNFVVSGGSNGITNKITLGGRLNGFVDHGTFFGGSSYAWIEGASFDPMTQILIPGYVRALNYGVDAGTATYAGGTSLPTGVAHVQTTGPVTAQVTATLLTLNLSGNSNFTLDSGAILTVNGILKTGNAPGGVTISGGTGIQAAKDQELVIRTDGTYDQLTINSPIVANPANTGASPTPSVSPGPSPFVGRNGLTKSGPGTLILGGTNTYNGNTSVNGGTLTFASGSSLSGDGSINVSAGATLNIDGTVDIGGHPVILQGTVGSPVIMTMAAGGSLTGVSSFYVSNSSIQGGGTVIVGTPTTTGNLYLGYDAGASGSYALSGTGTLSVSGSEGIGANGTGSFVQSGGINTAGSMFLGGGTGNTGSYLLSGDSTVKLTLAGTLGILAGGSSFTQNGGVNTNGGLQILGSAGSSSSYVLRAGKLSVSGGELILGSGGTASLIQSGGTHTAGSLSIGPGGSYTLSGDGTVTLTIDLYESIGGDGSGNATFTQSAGVNTVGSDLGISAGAGSTASYALSGTGVLTVKGQEQVGGFGTASFTQTGGTHTVGSNLAVTGGANSNSSYVLSGDNTVKLTIGGYETIASTGTGTGTSTFIQSGGVHSVTGGFTFDGVTYGLIVGLDAGSNGSYLLSNTGTYNVSGVEMVGAFGNGSFSQSGGTHTSGGLTLGFFSGANGSYALNGGTFQTNTVTAGGGTSTFNFNGGTLQAASTTTAFMSGLTLAKVQAGGARIDTQTYNVTVAQALLHDPVLGATADGGLTKSGIGTLTLTGANTYAGVTTITAGTLQLARAGGVALNNTATIEVKNSGTLLFGGNNQLNQAPLTLGTAGSGGTQAKIDAGGYSQGTGGTPAIPGSGSVGLGALTLVSNAVVDMTGTSILHFANTSGAPWIGTLSIYDWTGTPTIGGGAEQLLFGGDLTGLSATQLLQVSFYSDSGSTLLSNTALILADGEIIPGPMAPVPEPATWIAGGLMLVVVAYSQSRTFRRRAA